MLGTRRIATGCDQAHGVVMGAKPPRPVVRAGAGFHADQAGRQLGDQGRQVGARYLGLDHNRLAVIINPMHGEYVLRQINSNRDNARGLPLSCDD